LAQENNIQYQIEAVPGSSGTEADVVQLARNGIKTGLISIPLLNMHSPVETVSIQDIENTARLLAIFASKAGR
jgi:endoglucanase